MGTELSKAAEDIRNQNQGISREEVNRLLKQQQKDYEKKLKELKIRTSDAKNEGAPVAREATQSNVNDMMARQIHELVQNAAPRSQPSPNQYTSPLYQGSPQPGCSNANFNTRLNTPYSYAKEQIIQDSGLKSPQSLYPSLDTTKNYASGSQPKPQTKRNDFPVSFSPNNDFVMVGGPNRSAGGFSPSAPSLATVRPNSEPKARTVPKNIYDDGFNCKTCGKKFGIKIFNCDRGHSSCSDCKERGAPCGICRGRITDTRNRGVEDMVGERKSACPNAGDGCQLTFKQVDIENHLKECPYGDFVCPLSHFFGGCFWRGKLSHMASHFDDLHPENRQANIDTEMHLINILDKNHSIHFVDMGPWYFLVHLKVDDMKRNIYMTVQFMGTQISAKKWTYEVHVFNKRESRRKCLYTDTCTSVATPVEEIFADSKCVVLPQSYALSFVNEGSLTYKFFIKRDEDADAGNNYRGRGRGGFRGRGRGRGRGAKSDS